MKNKITLRQLVLNVWESNKTDFLNYIYQKDLDLMVDINLQKTQIAYQGVIDELLALSKSKPFKYSICVDLSKDWFSKEYIDVYLLNPMYVKPTKGLKPWGGKAPKGYYNINLKKHNKTFAFGYTSWSKLIDTFITNKTKLKQFEILAEILLELTFNGFTEKENQKFVDDLSKKFKKSINEIKKGKFTKLKKQNKNGYDVVIPNSVNEQIKNFSKEI